VRHIAALVVLGDAPGADDLLAEAIDAELPVLAFGTGAQILARALGAPVDDDPGGEVCVAPVYLTDEGCADRVLGRAPSPVHVLHERRGGYALPSGAVGLADSAVDPAPAFRFRRAYGVPFHLEVDAEVAATYEGCPVGFPTRETLCAGVAVLDAFACRGGSLARCW
jgi:GMP synthase-like glutamine amidotransferase